MTMTRLPVGPHGSLSISMFSLCCILSVILLHTRPVRGLISPCPARCICEDVKNRHVDCSAQRLTSPPLTSQSTFTLDLSRNQLGPILNGSIVQMANLTTLDLSRNGLVRLLACTFTGLLGLRDVRLQYNRMSTLPESLFTDCEHLEWLDLSHNVFMEMPGDILRYTARLKYLDLSNNLILSAKMGPRFQVPRVLEYLDLSHNEFDTISVDAFESAAQWEASVPRTLRLAHCRLTSIETGAMAKFPHIRDLDLSGNRNMTQAQLADIVKQLETKGLKRISVAETNISSLAPFFSNLTRMAVRFINASSNNIDSIPANIFSTIRSLRVLDLSHNALSALGPGFNDLVNLRVLNVSHNDMARFTGDAVMHLTTLRVLDISYNRLTSADISPLVKLKSLHVNNNLMGLVALPSNTSTLEHVFYQSNAITRFPGFMDAQHLETFDISHNELEFIQPFLFSHAKFVKVANLSHNSITNLNYKAFLPQSPLVVDLSHNSLREIKFSNWVATQVLLLDRNRLVTLDMRTFHGMNGLKVLDLSHNVLPSLHDELFHFMTSLVKLDLSYNQIGSFQSHLFQNAEVLEWLDLSHNNISHLNASTMLPINRLKYLSLGHNHLQIVMPRMFRDMNRLRELHLNNNPFLCNCDMLAFRDWISRTIVPIPGMYTANSTAYQCASPSKRKGRHITDWDIDQLECDQSLLYMIIFGAFGLFLIVAGVAGTAVYRVYRKLRERKRKKQHVKWELEWARRGRVKDKADRVRLTNDDIVEEIQDAIERKVHRGQRVEEERTRSNGYVTMPKGYGLRDEGTRVYKSDDRRVPGGGHHDRLRGYAGESRRVYREQQSERDRRMRAVRRDCDQQGLIVMPDDRLSKVPPEVGRRDSDLNAGGRPEIWYRPRSPRRLPVHTSPLRNSGGHAAYSDNRWEPVEVWGKPKYVQRQDNYFTLPSHGSVTHARRDSRCGGPVTMLLRPATRASEHHTTPHGRITTALPTQEVRFMEDGGSQATRRYTRARPSEDSVDRVRSHSYQQLSRENPENGPDRMQREYERIDRERPTVTQRAVSQPFLANEGASDWL